MSTFIKRKSGTFFIRPYNLRWPNTVCARLTDSVKRVKLREKCALINWIENLLGDAINRALGLW